MSFVFDVQRMIHIIQMNYGWSASSVSLTEDAVVNSKSHTKSPTDQKVFSLFSWHLVYHSLSYYCSRQMDGGLLDVME